MADKKKPSVWDQAIWRAPALSDLLRGVKFLTTADSKWKMATGIAHLGLGVLHGIFNASDWYKYEGTHVLPSVDATAPMDAQSNAEMTKAATLYGTPHVSMINAKINDLQSAELEAQVFNAFDILEEDMKGKNIQYDRDTLYAYLRCIYPFLVALKQYERRMGWRSITSGSMPELVKAMQSVPSSISTNGIVEMEPITYLADADLYSAEMADALRLSAEVKELVAPTKLLLFVSHYFGSTFVDENDRNATLYTMNAYSIPVPMAEPTGTKKNVQIIGVTEKRGRDVDAKWLYDRAHELRRVFGTLISNLKAYSNYRYVDFVPVDNYTPYVLCDPEFATTIKNAYGANVAEFSKDYFGTEIANPEYLRFDTHGMKPEEMIPSFLMAGAATTQIVTPFDITSQVTVVSGPDTRLPYVQPGVKTSFPSNNGTHFSFPVGANGERAEIIGVQFGAIVNSGYTVTSAAASSKGTFYWDNTMTRARAEQIAATVDGAKDVAIYLGANVGNQSQQIQRFEPGPYYTVYNQPLCQIGNGRVYLAARFSDLADLKYQPKLIYVDDMVSMPSVNAPGFTTLSSSSVSSSLDVTFGGFDITDNHNSNDLGAIYTIRANFSEYAQNRFMELYNGSRDNAIRGVEQGYIVMAASIATGAFSAGSVQYEDTQDVGSMTIAEENASGLLNWFTTVQSIHIPILMRPYIRTATSIYGAGNYNTTSTYPSLLKDVDNPVMISRYSLLQAQRWAINGLYSVMIPKRGKDDAPKSENK